MSLCLCPQHHGGILVVQEIMQDGALDDPQRLWPEPPRSFWRIPSEIRESLKEADRCLKCGANTASVGMSGRALEAIGRHFNPKQKKPLMLAAGLQKLHEEEIIDSRLLEWGKALAQDRNLAAHASGTHFSPEDAEDIFKFTMNICEYVFVLSEQFKEYMKRRSQRNI